MRSARSVVVVVSALLTACSADPAESHVGFDSDNGGDSSESSGDSDADSSGPDDTSGTDDGEPASPQRFDLGAPDVGQDAPCGQVDVLFVIDNSASMADEQANLVASFPGFITGIESILPSADYHVGVITTDANEWNGTGCHRIGALTVATGGEASSDAQCGPYASGHRFMTAQDDLERAFSCAAQVGIEGSGVERPMDAIAAALDPLAADLAVCNSLFLREGALLVLVLITDEEDDGDSVGGPAEWKQNLLAAKGDEDGIVVLGLVGHDKPNACIAEQWDGMAGAEIAPRLIEFTESFAHGEVGDVCAPSYAEFFTDGIVGIADACHVVVPVG
jgi:hypothetical protein